MREVNLEEETSGPPFLLCQGEILFPRPFFSLPSCRRVEFGLVAQSRTRESLPSKSNPESFPVSRSARDVRAGDGKGYVVGLSNLPESIDLLPLDGLDGRGGDVGALISFLAPAPSEVPGLRDLLLS